MPKDYTQLAIQTIGEAYEEHTANSYEDHRKFYDDLEQSTHIVYLSSIEFAVTTLQIFSESILSHVNRTYSFLFGDFWGDPRQADTLFGLIVQLVENGHKVYALRNDINGTEVIQKHMASIRLNSDEWNRNKWLQRYWHNHYNCSDQCNANESLPAIIRPILRNYKAALVMVGVSLIREFVEIHYANYKELPGTFDLGDGFLRFGANRTIENKETGNKLVFGETGHTHRSFHWQQPLQWQYRILELEMVIETESDTGGDGVYSRDMNVSENTSNETMLGLGFNDTSNGTTESTDVLGGKEYGIWTIDRNGIESNNGHLYVFVNNSEFPTTPTVNSVDNNMNVDNNTIVDNSTNASVNSTASSEIPTVVSTPTVNISDSVGNMTDFGSNTNGSLVNSTVMSTITPIQQQPLPKFQTCPTTAVPTTTMPTTAVPTTSVPTTLTMKPTMKFIDDSCNPDKLHGMVGLVVVILLLLIAVCLVYIWNDSCVRIKSDNDETVRNDNNIKVSVKRVLRSPGYSILLGLTLFSICICFWIIFGDESFDCDNRGDDFLVNLANGVCFTVLLIYVACRRFENRLGQLCLKIFGFLALVMIQLIVAAVAHFDKVEKFDDNSTAIEHCYQERGKSVVAGSYWFGAILMIAFIALLIVDLCVKKDEEDEHHFTVFDIIRTSIAVAASILYMIGLVFVVHVDSTSQCLNHGRWFIFLALFPAFVGLLVSALQTVKSIREKRREIQEYRYSIELLSK